MSAREAWQETLLTWVSTQHPLTVALIAGLFAVVGVLILTIPKLLIYLVGIACLLAALLLAFSLLTLPSRRH